MSNYEYVKSILKAGVFFAGFVFLLSNSTGCTRTWTHIDPTLKSYLTGAIPRIAENHHYVVHLDKTNKIFVDKYQGDDFSDSGKTVLEIPFVEAEDEHELWDIGNNGTVLFQSTKTDPNAIEFYVARIVQDDEYENTFLPDLISTVFADLAVDEYQIRSGHLSDEGDKAVLWVNGVAGAEGRAWIASIDLTDDTAVRKEIGFDFLDLGISSVLDCDGDASTVIGSYLRREYLDSKMAVSYAMIIDTATGELTELPNPKGKWSPGNFGRGISSDGNLGTGRCGEYLVIWRGLAGPGDEIRIQVAESVNDFLHLNFA